MKRAKFWHCSLLVGFFLSAPLVFSQTATSESQVQSETRSSLNLGASVDYSTNAVRHDDGTDRQSLGYSLDAGYSFLTHYSLSTKLSLDQDLEDSREKTVELRAMSAALGRKPLPLGEWIQWAPRLSAQFPVNEELATNQSLILGLSFGNRFSLDSQALNLPRWSFSYLLGATKNFHEFVETLDGRINNSFSLSNAVGIGYSFTKTLRLSLSGGLSSVWNYNGTLTSVFRASQALSWRFHPNLSLSFGHENAGATLRANGVDSNLAVFDENASTLFISLSGQISI